MIRKTRRLSSLATAFIKAKVMGKKVPLAVGWALTYRCNRSCAYCGLWKKQIEELSTQEVLRTIDALKGLGCAFISFTGGEPLLRDDIGYILDYLRQKDISSKLNSNGCLVPEKMRDLKNLGSLMLSLDGPREIHDLIRHKGSFEEVMAAARIARANGMKLDFATVLTKNNLEELDFILEKAKEFNSTVSFQPATGLVLGEGCANPFTPPTNAYRQAITGLIRRKKAGSRNIGNSLSALRHLYYWPGKRNIRCAAGFISCRIEPNGDVLYCSREPHNFAPGNCLREGLKNAFLGLRPVSCDQCWCSGRVELNRVFSLDWSALAEYLKKGEISHAGK